MLDILKDIERTRNGHVVKKLSHDSKILKYRIDNLLNSFSGSIPRVELISAFEISSRQFHRWCKKLKIFTPKGKKTYRKGEVFKIYYFVQACINLGLLTQTQYETEIVKGELDFIDWYRQQQKKEIEDYGRYAEFEFLHSPAVGRQVQCVAESIDRSGKDLESSIANSDDWKQE